MGNLSEKHCVDINTILRWHPHLETLGTTSILIFYSKNTLLEQAEKTVHEGWPKLKRQEGHYVKSIGYKGVNQRIKREAMTTWQQLQLSECCASE